MKILSPNTLSVITATGCRKEAFEICCWLMRRQTVRRFQWIVVDDDPGTVIYAHDLLRDFDITVVRPMPRWEPGWNTLNRNLEEGLKHATGDWIAFVEDDDWYDRAYLQKMLDAAVVNRAHAVGAKYARYYHLPTRRYKQMDNDGHASLCQTMIHREALPWLGKQIASGVPFLDVLFWREIWETTLRAHLLPDSSLTVGIKGLPGRSGIGCGHHPPEAWPVDSNGSKLRDWIGADAHLYKPYLGHRHE